MRRWRALTVAAAAIVVGIVFLAAVLEFLAPDLAYYVKDRIAEMVSGTRGRTYRIALGSTTGSNYRVGTVLNRYLKEKAGYELQLVSSAMTANLGSLLDPKNGVELATLNTMSDEVAKGDGIYGVAALESQYFFVIVPNASPVQEFRDLRGPVNPGPRGPGQPPTIGERVLEFYGMLSPPAGAGGQTPLVSVVRPERGNIEDFKSGHMAAATRTQFLNSDLIEGILRTGNYRLVPIRDHEALAKSISGAKPGFIPAGLFGPGRRIPVQPVPTITATQLLVARADIPGRVVRDILDVIYDPRFARDTQYAVTEESGRAAGGLPLHPAAEIYYHRNDLVTSDRLGRLSFVASAIAAVFTGFQFITRTRRAERMRSRRRLLGSELEKLQAIRRRIEESPDAATVQALIREADDLLSDAERDAAADLLDADGIQAIRSLHGVCGRATEYRLETLSITEAARVAMPPGNPVT